MCVVPVEGARGACVSYRAARPGGRIFPQCSSKIAPSGPSARLRKTRSSCAMEKLLRSVPPGWKTFSRRCVIQGEIAEFKPGAREMRALPFRRLGRETFDRCRGLVRRGSAKTQKFFGSFFQKRTALLLAAGHRGPKFAASAVSPCPLYTVTAGYGNTGRLIDGSFNAPGDWPKKCGVKPVFGSRALAMMIWSGACHVPPSLPVRSACRSHKARRRPDNGRRPVRGTA